jgi:competence protein ComEA
VVLARLASVLRWWGIRRIIGVTLATFAAAAVAYWSVQVEPPPVESAIPVVTLQPPPPTSGEITVHVGGEVVNPGVYRLPAGARVVDAVTAAGGVTNKAETDLINLAAPLADAIQVLVPRQGALPRPLPIKTAPAVAPTGPTLVNINTATLEELESLPGVGPSTARAIVETRGKRGVFTSPDDLLDVPGIGPAKLSQIRALVTW